MDSMVYRGLAIWPYSDKNAERKGEAMRFKDHREKVVRKFRVWKAGLGGIPNLVKPVDSASIPDILKAVVEKQNGGFLGRNSRCPCGSDKRVKSCCMIK